MNGRAPISVVGALGVWGLAGFLAMESPSPGKLSAVHSAEGNLDGPANCRECHRPEGLSASCLDCHAEIAEQVERGSGLHASFHQEGIAACAPCHGEHYGAGFPLVNSRSWDYRDPQDFRHGHVEFAFVGAHDGLGCEECHDRSRPASAAAPSRVSYLGLTQGCDTCHEETHGPELAGTCDTCHDQHQFAPASRFEHSARYVLEGAHANAECRGCHPSMDAEVRPISFAVEATDCAGCHETPHVGSNEQMFGEDCSSCHAPERFEEYHYDRAEHREFPLDGAHAVACDSCHTGGAPALPGLDSAACATCHAHPHRVALAEPAGGCAECHQLGDLLWNAGAERLSPEHHQGTGFALEAPHSGLDCGQCHGMTGEFAERFPGRSPEVCAVCHEDPHAGQFEGRAGGCADCHEGTAFLPAAFGLADHETYALTGSHLAVACSACHEVHADTGVRRFSGLGEACRDCHENPHGTQFEPELAADGCAGCHPTPETWHLRPYDHAATGWPLTGGHRGAQCADCHFAPAAAEAVPYRGTSRQCLSCHDDPHRGQLTGPEQGDCDRCHTSPETWLPARFDHQTQSRYPLDGTHLEVACQACHPAARLADGSSFVRYRPLGTRCQDCHETR